MPGRRHEKSHSGLLTRMATYFLVWVRLSGKGKHGSRRADLGRSGASYTVRFPNWLGARWRLTLIGALHWAGRVLILDRLLSLDVR